MSDQKMACGDSAQAGVAAKEGATGSVLGGGTFNVECFDAEGNLKWATDAKNLVPSAGLAFINQQLFKASAYTAEWYFGLVNNTAFTAYDAGDTLAVHPGWTESTGYVGTNRIDASFGTPTAATPSVIANTVATGGTVAVFDINTDDDIRGVLVTESQAKATTSGVLLAVADFSTGVRQVKSGDTLNVTYTYQSNTA